MHKKTKTTILSFCTIDIYENTIVGTINDGVDVTLEKSSQIIEVAINHFKAEPFVYIANRKNSYSVDPIIYKYNSELKNLKGFAIVIDNLYDNTVEIEKIFSHKPIDTFDSLDDALDWSNRIIKDTK